MSSAMIPLFDVQITAEDRQAVAQCLESGWVSTAGPTIAEFEQAIGNVIKVKRVLATSTGTAALHLALQVEGVGAGDWVLLPSTTFVATANAVSMLGAKCIFVDVDSQHYNLCLQDLKRTLIEVRQQGIKPKALLMVHLLGHTGDIFGIQNFCKQEGLLLIEDAAQCLGATAKGQALGSFGCVATTSFNGNKIVTSGGGGAVMSDDDRLIDRCRFLSQQARVPGGEYIHDEVGFNYRLPNLNAALGLSQIKRLPQLIETKRKIFETYRAGLSDLKGVRLVESPEGVNSNHWMPVISLDSRVIQKTTDQIKNEMQQKQIAIGKFYFPMHLQKPFLNNEVKRALPISEKIYRQTLVLPYAVTLSGAQQAQILQTLRDVLHGT